MNEKQNDDANTGLNIDILFDLVSKKLMFKLFRALPVSVVITNMSGDIIFVNKYFEHLTGYSNQEVLGKNPRILKSGKTPEKNYKKLWDNLSAGKTWQGYFVNQKKDKTTYFEKAVIYPFLNKKNNETYYISLKTDISNEVYLKQRFLKRQRFLSNLVNSFNTGYLLLKNDETVIFNNVFFRKSFEIDEDINGKKISDFIDDKELKEEIRRIIKQTFKVFISVAYIKIRDKKWLEVYSKKISEDKILIHFQDVTYLKKTEAKLLGRTSQLLNLINILNIAIFSIDLDGKIENFNKKAHEMIKSQEKTYGNFLDYFITKSGEKDLKMGAILIQNTNELESFFRKSDGNIINVSVSTVFSTNKYSNETIICVVNDITRLHKRSEILENEVKRKTKQLQESLKIEKELNILKSDFISKTSHEFRTPLATISIASEFLNKYIFKLSDEKISLKLEKIIGETKKMTDLLDDFLMLEKINSGKLEHDLTITNLCIFVSNIVDNYQELYQDFIFVKECNDKDIFVAIDDKLGSSIFQNLISNAVKYSKDKKQINIKIYKENRYAVIEIQDYGIGIPEIFKKNIYSPFARAENSAAMPGAGLGLPIVKEAVDKHGGKISFLSEINAGTTFKIMLPLI
jgi:PAS domain S-box-containing protein